MFALTPRPKMSSLCVVRSNSTPTASQGVACHPPPMIHPGPTPPTRALESIAATPPTTSTRPADRFCARAGRMLTRKIRGTRMAERVGFEPTVGGSPLHTLSKRAPSTTQTSLHDCTLAGIKSNSLKRVCVLIGSKWQRTLGVLPVAMGRTVARTLCNFSLRTASGPEGSSAK